MAAKKASASDIKKYASQTLKAGSKGPAVEFLQEQLTSAGVKTDVDGAFGSGTKKSVQDFQKKNKLSVDGIVGPQTWGALVKGQGGASDPPEKQREKTGDTGDDQTGAEAGQCVIRVRVVCSTSGRGTTMPVQGAEVKIGRAKKRTATNGDAELIVRPGRYKAEVKKRGFRLEHENSGYDIRATAGQTMPVDIKLVPDEGNRGDAGSAAKR